MIMLIVVIVLIAIIGCVAYFMSQNSNESQRGDNANQEGLAEQNSATTNSNQVAEESNGATSEDNSTSQGSRTLVVYYSASGNTEEIANKLAESLEADIFEIEPVDEYTTEDLNWRDDGSRVSREYEDESLRNVELQSTTVENWEDYDTVLIGYPIWWGIAAWPVDTFVTANDFNGKTVIPFCTSTSSGLGSSGALLAEEANGGDWQEGQRFRENPSDEDIQEFIDSINQ